MPVPVGVVALVKVTVPGPAPVLASLALATRAADKPNILFIISDDQAWTDYSFMGHAAIQTPRIDRLARESLTFRRGYVTCSLCSPSLASLITGRYPHETKFTGNEPPSPKGAAAARGPAGQAWRRRRELIADVGALPGETVMAERR